MNDNENNHQDKPKKQGDFPPISAGDETLDDTGIGVHPERPLPPPQIKGYKIIQKLGEGGMGIVYLAEKTEVIKLKVALKVIKPGKGSKQVLAHFEVERQALALLKHANIAQVFDAGSTDDGRPYFVMEYVEGIPITDYCDQKKLSSQNGLNCSSKYAKPSNMPTRKELSIEILVHPMSWSVKKTDSLSLKS